MMRIMMNRLVLLLLPSYYSLRVVFAQSHESQHGSSNIFEGGGSFAIPGTTQTANGYDTELGVDPMCWRSYNSHNNDNNSSNSSSTKMPFPNYLLKDFWLSGRVELLSSCPRNNYVQGFAPVEKVLLGERLRTRTRWYNYSATFTLDLSTLSSSSSSGSGADATAAEFVSDPPETHRISVQIVLCKLGASGFCSPFIHDESDARLAAQNITISPPVGDLHGGSHVHSPRVFLELNPQDGPRYSNISVDIPMLCNVPGEYYAIVAVQMFVRQKTQQNTSSSSTMIVRYDMANKLSGNYTLLSYQDPPMILQVPDAVLIVSYVGIAMVGSVILFLLAQTIRHRHSKVLTLTQGPFLIVFLLAALMATVSSFLLEPKNDIYCQASFPIILISLQLVFAITIGRLWRIHAVISPLLMQTLQQRPEQQTWKTRLVHRIRRRLLQLSGMLAPATSSSVVTESATTTGTSTIAYNNNNNSGSSTSQRGILTKVSSTRKAAAAVTDHSTNTRTRRGQNRQLRRQVTSAQLAAVIAMFTLPQVVVQILSVTLQPATFTILFNDDESIGRAMCQRGNGSSPSTTYSASFYFTSLVYYGAFLFLLLVIFLLFLAHVTQGLPSLFNETRVIFESTISSMVALLVGLGVISITRGPTTSPGVEYLVSTLLILTLTLNMTWRIVVPKLQMIWRGETVLVSKLVSDHAKSVRHKSHNNNSNSNNYSGTSTPLNASHSLGNSIVSGLTMPTIMMSPRPRLVHQKSTSSAASGGGGSGGSGRPVWSARESVSAELKLELERFNSTPCYYRRTTTTMTSTSTTMRESTDENSNSVGDSCGKDADEHSDSLVESDGRGNALGRPKSNENRNINEMPETAMPFRGNTTNREKKEGGGSSDTISPLSSQKSSSTRVMMSREGLLRKACSMPSQNWQLSPNSNPCRHHPHQGSIVSSSCSSPRRLRRRILVTKEETPARRLVLKMVDLQEQLASVNGRIMSGLAVSEEEWTKLRLLSCNMGYVFTEEIKFEWETPREAELVMMEARSLRGSLLRRRRSSSAANDTTAAADAAGNFSRAGSNRSNNSSNHRQQQFPLLRHPDSIAEMNDLLQEEEEEDDDDDDDESYYDEDNEGENEDVGNYGDGRRESDLLLLLEHNDEGAADTDSSDDGDISVIEV